MARLTPKQEKFIKLVFDGVSQRKAYREAYPISVKWKDGTVDNRASELFNRDEIMGRHDELRATAEKESIITHNMIREELAKMAFFDVAEILNDDGSLKEISEMSETARKVISSVKIRTEKSKDGDISYITEVKLNDKGQSIDKLAKHIGFYERDNSQKQNNVIVVAAPKEFDMA